MERLRAWARGLKRDLRAVHLCARDPRTPVAAKLLALAVVAYALSPVDLIPDFIPVLGYLDDLLLVPLGLWLVLRMVPEEVLAENRAAAEGAPPLKRSRAAAVAVVGLWLALAVAAGAWALRLAGYD